MSKVQEIISSSNCISQDCQVLINQIEQASTNSAAPFILTFSIFILACFVGYFVVWRVTPALHTPLMAVTNAISGAIIVGAIIALGSVEEFSLVAFLSFFAIIIASINIFGGFFVTYRMLEMFKK